MDSITVVGATETAAKRERRPWLEADLHPWMTRRKHPEALSRICYNAAMSRLIIICGISFAGKTTLGKAITARFGYAEVDVDETKTVLFGPDVQDQNLSHPDWVRIYAETDALMERYLQAGETVVDASRNFRKFERQSARAIADKVKAEVITIFVDTPAAVARQRLHANRITKTRVDFADKEFEELAQLTEPPTPDEHALIFHYGDQLDRWISENIHEKS